MPVRGILVVSAALAAVLGLVALTTAAGLAAMAAGLSAVVAAGSSLALTRIGARAVPVRIDDPGSVDDGAYPGEPGQDEVHEVVGEDGLDPTGLLGDGFLETTLRGRVAIARRALRPLSIVYFEAETVGPDTTAELAPDEVAAALKATLRASDTAGRRHGGPYVFILEDTGEDGAVWTAERLRRTLVATTGSCRFRAGIASYPTHGLEAVDLETKAQAALHAARDWARDRIEVAPTP